MTYSFVRPVLTATLSFLTLSAGMIAPAAAEKRVAPVRKWTFADNQASIFLDRTYAGGNAQTFDDYIGAQDTRLTGVPGAPYQFDSYCIDAGADIQRPFTPVEVFSTDLFPLGLPGLPPGVTHGGAAAWLLNNYYFSAFTDQRTSAALQLSIWEVVEDWNGLSSSINLSSGNLRYLGNPDPAITADIRGRADAMLLDWNGQQSESYWFDGLPNAGNANPQDLIGPRITIIDAPEPAALSLLLPVIVVAAVVRRRAR